METQGYETPHGSEFRVYAVDRLKAELQTAAATHPYLRTPLILFQNLLTRDGLSWRRSGDFTAFGDGDGEGEGVAVGVGDAAAFALADEELLSPSHHLAASTPEPRIAIRRISATANMRPRESEGCANGTLNLSKPGRFAASTAAATRGESAVAAVVPAACTWRRVARSITSRPEGLSVPALRSASRLGE